LHNGTQEKARTVARRGGNSFRRLDAIRALRAAQEAGLDPAAIEVVVATAERERHHD
jgi:hypothetical protein